LEFFLYINIFSLFFFKVYHNYFFKQKPYYKNIVSLPKNPPNIKKKNYTFNSGFLLYFFDRNILTFFKDTFYKILLLGKNVLFINDNTFDVNYLPINNIKTFSGRRCVKKLHKMLKYFNVSVIFFLNLPSKESFLKKFYNCNCLLVTGNKNITFNKFFDYSFDLPNTPLSNYIFYLFVLRFYLQFKKLF